MGKRTQRPAVEQTGMLTEGNAHIGRAVWAFSIPAVMSCPGMTLACTIACYAMNFLFIHVKQNFSRHERTFERAEREPNPFARDLIMEIRFKRVQILRIHVAGDFFSEDYIRAWTRVVKACKRTTFLFYTRSWRVPEFVPALLELAALPNMWAWWSEDRDSGPAHFPVGRRAFLMVDPEDERLVPADVDLVFRTDTRVPQKWVGPVWVCAKEQGIANGLACETCRQCFVPGPMPRGRERTTEPTLFPMEAADGRGKKALDGAGAVHRRTRAVVSE